MQQNLKRSLKHLHALSALFLLWLLVPPVQTYAAACINGIPCVVDKTANDPFDPADGPNASGAPNATKSGSAACDADFMNQIYGRALLEAERENVMGQVVLRKADSVLDYSCFKDVINHTDPPLGAVFSNATGDLNKALQKLVISALDKYMTSNFNYAFLGGASPTAVGQPDCPRMNAIYNLAQCNDFALDDPFKLFATLATPDDPRLLPEACSAGTTQITTDFVDLAENKGFASVNFDDLNVSKLYLDRLLIGGSPAVTCFNPPIPTGHMITYESKSVGTTGKVSVDSALTVTYEEQICPNPGCYYDYDPTSNTGTCK